MGKKSKKSMRVVEKLLDSSFLTCHTLVEETRETNTLLACPVRNYSKLEQGVKYLIKDYLYGRGCYLSFVKFINKLFAWLSVEAYCEDTLIGLRSSDGQIVRGIYLNETEGSSVFKFENETILDPQMKLLNDDILVIECVFTAVPHETNIVIMSSLQEKPCELMQNSDVDSLCNDLRDLYLSSRFYDLIITTDKRNFKVHKFIMCARSAYFEKLSHRCPGFVRENMPFNVEPIIMHEVLLYIYGGQLRDMELIKMADIFKVACRLEIESLIVTCTNFFKANFFKANFPITALPYIVQLAKEFNVKQLGKEAKYFLENRPNESPESKESKYCVEHATNMLESMDI